jgi:hypothetical protein
VSVTNSYDVTGHSQLTVIGTPTLTTGIVGTNAIRLTNTAGESVSQAIRGTWNAVQNFTVSFWFSMQTVNSSLYQLVFSAFSGFLTVQITPTSNYIAGLVPTNGTYVGFTIPSYTAAVANTWYNVTIIYQTNGTCYMYLNNALYGTANVTGIQTSGTNVFQLGSYDNNNANATNCTIDDVRIYNSAVLPYMLLSSGISNVPLIYNNVAVSNTGQYMLAAATDAGLYMSSNFGSTWTQVTGAMLSALWSSTQVSATGQYMLAYAAPVMVQPQLTGLSRASWQINGISWTSSASSTLDAYLSYYMFDNNFNVNSRWVTSLEKYTTSGNTSGINTTILGGIGSVQGDWLQLQSSVPIVMTSYQFANGYLNTRLPKTYYIIGSNDGTNWYPIQYGSGGTVPTIAQYTLISSTIIVNSASTQIFGTGSITTTIYSTTTSAYLYFRLITLSNYSSSVDYIDICEWIINFQAGGQTYSTNYGSTWSNQPSLYSQQMLMPGPTITPQLTGLTGLTNSSSPIQTTWQQTGVSWTSNASSVFGTTWQPWIAFNNTVPTSTAGGSYSWASLARYTFSTGVYNNTVSTIIQSPAAQTYTGEWLQIQSNTPLVLYSYNFGANSDAPNNMPKTYFIVGSNDGTNWYPIQQASINTNPFTTSGIPTSLPIIVNQSGAQIMSSAAASGTVTCTAYSTSANTYTYFRIIANTTFGATAFELDEWFINFIGPPTSATITYPSATTTLSESGQYALTSTVSNPVLLGELNFENSYVDTAPTPTLTYVGNSGGNILLSTAQAKVGTYSLSSTNDAGSESNLSYANYRLPAFFTSANAYTISAWIYPTAYPSSSNNPASPFALTNGTTLSSSLLYFYPNGTLGLFYYTTLSTSTAVGFISVNSITTNTWSHVAYIFASGMAYLYINGVLSGSNSYTGTICLRSSTGTPTNLLIGCANSEWGGYRGFIDNLRIYNSALTPQQIQTIYANNASSTTLTQISPSFSVSPQQTGLITNTWNQGGIAWTSSASSNFNADSNPYKLFNNKINYNPTDGTAEDVWSSLSGGYSGIPGNYNYSTTTSVTGLGSILGEWFQLQTLVPLVMYSYSCTCYNQVGVAYRYYIVGSNDGQTWYPIQFATYAPGTTNPFNAPAQRQTNFTLVNVNGSQTVTAGTSQTLNTTTYSTTTNAYTYFRVIATQIFAGTLSGLFQYSEFSPIFIAPSNGSLYNVVSPITNFSSGVSVNAGIIPGVIINSAVSNTGQYMVIITNNTSGNNVYYSMNYGATFTGVQVGTQVLTSCAISYDGSYITIASGATVYTLNNNSTGFSVALGNQAGYQNQANNAIAIGNYAGYQNQTANSIILNATGQGVSGLGLNSYINGFYVAPIASYTASVSQTFTMLGYGTDNQVVQTGITTLSGGNGNIGIGTTIPSGIFLQTTNGGSVPGSGSSIPQYSLDVAGTSRTITQQFIDNSAQVTATPSLDYTTFGQNWATVSGLSTSTTWSGCAVSANGQYITISSSGVSGAIWYSQNYGQTWTNASLIAQSYSGIAMSASGQYQLSGVGSSGTLFISMNYGVTWVSVNTGLSNWSKFCMSASGQYQYALSISAISTVYISTNYGQNWLPLYTLANMQALCCSASGQYIALGGYLTTIYYSSNYGQSFIASNASAGNNWKDICMSASGQYVSATATAGQGIYYSSTYGQTWTLSNITGSAMNNVCCSASGQYQIASNALTFGTQYYSTNYGQTWLSAGGYANGCSASCISSTGQYVYLACNATFGVLQSVTYQPSLNVSGSILGTMLSQYKYSFATSSSTMNLTTTFGINVAGTQTSRFFLVSITNDWGGSARSDGSLFFLFIPNNNTGTFAYWPIASSGLLNGATGTYSLNVTGYNTITISTGQWTTGVTTTVVLTRLSI